MENLNDAQRAAVLHTEGPLLLLAGAGSGKTRALTHRIAYLIREKSVPPWHILAVTFTNKAAGELKERLEGLVGAASRDIWARTFHSTCAQILRREISSLDGYTPSFTIYDTADQAALTKRVLTELEIDSQRLRPFDALGAIGRAKNEMRGPVEFENAASDYLERQIAQVYRAYQQHLRANNALDFDDLLLLTVQLFTEHPDVLGKYQERFRYVHVDEYQDTNAAQYQLTKMLAAKHVNVCVVGDDDQSIYSWRGADIRNILDFERDYPNARVIHLIENYRCSGNILDAAQHIVRMNRRRHHKELFTSNDAGAPVRYYEAHDERSEAEFVVDTLDKLSREHGITRDRVAVFYRINAQSRSFEEVFRERNIPYQIVGGVRFYERQEIKDVIAYLRVLVNPKDDVSLLRIINTPTRGIGKRALERVQAYARDHYLTIYEAVHQADQIAELGAAGQRNMGRFTEILRTIETGGTLAEVIESTLEKSGYLELLRTDATPEDDARLENLAEFASAAAEFEEREEDATLDGFLEAITLASDIDGLDSDSGTVTLMTLHGAKGLEFPVVFLTGMEEGLVPHQRSLVRESELEEERRLCYVGMTRAMTHLYLSRARVRRTHGEFQATLRSRFLDDIPSSVVEEISPWPSSDGFDGRSTRVFADKRPPTATWRGRTAVDEPTSRSISTFDADSQVLEDDEVAFLRANAHVTHPRFGDGTVTAVEGRGENLRVTVRFEDGAEKSLLAAYAKLQPIEHEG